MSLILLAVFLEIQDLFLCLELWFDFLFSRAEVIHNVFLPHPPCLASPVGLQSPSPHPWGSSFQNLVLSLHF